MNTRNRMRVERHCAGCYHVAYRGRYFEIRSMAYHTEGESSEVAWIVLERDEWHGVNPPHGTDGYWDHYASKKDAKWFIMAGVDADLEGKQ